MATVVTLALVGDPDSPGGRIEPDEWEKSWDERRQVRLEVEDQESLAALIERAAQEFEVAPDPRGLRLVHTVDLTIWVDDDPRSPQGALSALVDDEGKALWHIHDLATIPYGQLVRSVRAGALVGDPQRLYFTLREPVGNGLGLDWETVVQAWLAIWLILERLDAMGGATEVVRSVLAAVQRRLGRGRETMDQNIHRWAQRGALPYQFARFLDRDVWAAEVLASLLSCSTQDAEAVLALFGFAYDDADGLWHRDGDRAGRLLRAGYQEAEWHGRDLLISERSRLEFEQRVEEMLRSGEPLPEPTYDSEDFEEEPEFFEFASLTIAPEGVVGVGTLGGRQVQIHVAAEELRDELAELFNRELIPLAWRVVASEVARLGADVGRLVEDDHAPS